MTQLLVVADDPQLFDFVAAALRASDLTIESVATGEQALARVRENSPEIMLLDLGLPGIDGLETLRRLRQKGFEFPVVVITSHGDAETTIQAIQEGAWDYLTKPLHGSDLTVLVERLLRHTVKAEALEVGADLDEQKRAWPLLGRSPAMLEVFKTIGRVAKHNLSVLLVGESGSGKELVAHAIHAHSGRTGPFLAINCAGVPEILLESEFFGREKSAKRTPSRRRIGKLERARHGTLLLDDVGDLSLPLQGRMLRVLEERALERLGDSEVAAVSVRLIAASLRELDELVAEGGFREDLFFRLAEVTIRIPALRDRGEDLRLLTDHFIRRLAPRIGRRIESIEPEVYQRLQAHEWPGNVRELRNVLEQALVMGQGPVLTVADLPGGLTLRQVPPSDLGSRIEVVEKGHIARVLGETSWNQTLAAQRLGIHRNTLRRKIHEYHLHPPTQGGVERG